MKASKVRPITIASRWVREERGAAAVEFALWLGIILWPLLNVVDLGLWAFQKMQVDNAGQAAAQQVFNNCGQSTLAPVLTNCSVNTTTIANSGVQSTSLGANVTQAMTECVGSTRKSGTVTCPSWLSSNGDYVGVTASYTYHPLFPNITVTSILTNSAMSSTAWMRMS